MAKAVAGNGGNINISTLRIYSAAAQPVNELIDASSGKGIDGEISISSPESYVEVDIVNLPTDFIDASTWISKSCASRDPHSLQLIDKSFAGVVLSPSDWQPSLFFNRLN